MKYFYEKPAEWVGAGETYICNHPFYNRCTLFRVGNRGIAIVQERFNEKTKARWWGPVEPWLSGDIYLNPGFHDFFLKKLPQNQTIMVYIRQLRFEKLCGNFA